MNNKTVLVTGASSGIGKELSVLFALKGYNLLLVARRENLLEQLKEELTKKYKVNVDYFVCDLTDNYLELYEHCKKNNIKIDVLVNNAGFGDYCEFIDCDIKKIESMIDLNNKALVGLTYYFIQEMKSTGGHILNVGSVASFVPGPYMAVYYATKSFVLSYSMALRQELKKYKIRVSVLCPGPTKSEFWDVAKGETTNTYNDVFSRSCLAVAETGIKAYEKNKPYLVDGIMYKIGIQIMRILPISLSSRLIGFVQKKTKNKKDCC